MLLALTLATAAAVVNLTSGPLLLHCFTGEDVPSRPFSVQIDAKAGSMTVSYDPRSPYTFPASIKPGLIVGRGAIHYNPATYEITLPDLAIRVTSSPHIWAGAMPVFVEHGRCTQDPLKKDPLKNRARSFRPSAQSRVR